MSSTPSIDECSGLSIDIRVTDKKNSAHGACSSHTNNDHWTPALDGPYEADLISVSRVSDCENQIAFLLSVFLFKQRKQFSSSSSSFLFLLLLFGRGPSAVHDWLPFLSFYDISRTTSDPTSTSLA